MFRKFALYVAPSFMVLSPALALPTIRSIELIAERGAFHACSLQVKRWFANDFDTAYFSSGLNSDNSVNNAYNFWTQESAVTAQGDELVPKVIGSNKLRIWNVRNPVDRNDGGELRFSYGSQSWDSWSAGSPCVVVPIGTGSLSGFTSVSCNFSCDF